MYHMVATSTPGWGPDGALGDWSAATRRAKTVGAAPGSRREDIPVNQIIEASLRSPEVR
jgi:hypothetical protein